MTTLHPEGNTQNPFDLGRAVELKTDMWSALDGVMIGNPVAKLGSIVMEFGEIDGVAFGVPGTGKTLLARRMSQLTGTPEHAIANIPADPNTGFEKLIGDITEIEERSQAGEDGPIASRTIGFRNRALITPDTEIIVADELNRHPSEELTALLQIMEERSVTDSQGRIIAFPNLRYMISTMNEQDFMQGTVKVPDALASRKMVGMPFGVLGSDAAATHLANVRGFMPTDIAKPIASRDEMARLRTYTDQAHPNGLRIVEGAATDRLIVDLATKTDAVLRAEGIKEGLERRGKQIGRVARTLTLLNGKAIVGEGADGEQVLRQAYFFNTAARLGMLSPDGAEASKELYATLDVDIQPPKAA